MDEQQYRRELNDLEEQLSVIYRRRRELTAAFADDHPAVLPPPRYRTDVQARIARCPRCGTLLSEDEGAKK